MAGDAAVVDTIKGLLRKEQSIKAKLQGVNGLSGKLTVETVNFDVYDGPFEVTPTQEPQVLYTSHKIAAENIVIDPIPSNYGLITWNGSVLTVS